MRPLANYTQRLEAFASRAMRLRTVAVFVSTMVTERKALLETYAERR